MYNQCYNAGIKSYWEDGKLWVDKKDVVKAEWAQVHLAVIINGWYQGDRPRANRELKRTLEILGWYDLRIDGDHGRELAWALGKDQMYLNVPNRERIVD